LQFNSIMAFTRSRVNVQRFAHAAALVLAFQLADVLALNIAGHWEIQDQPVPRMQASAACDENQLYLYGGRDDDEHVMNDLWRYDPVRDDWEQLFGGGAEPKRVDSGIAVLGEDYVYVLGGVDIFGEIQEEMVRYDPVDKYYEDVPMIDFMPTVRSQHSMIGGLDDRFYVAFGLGPHRLLNDMVMYNATDNTWTALADLNDDEEAIGVTYPEPRYSSCCDMNDAIDTIYCFGGQSRYDQMDDLWKFDLKLNQWSEVLPADGKRPPARTGSLCGFKQGKFMIGLGADTNEKLINDMWYFDTTDSLWHAAPTPPITASDTTGCLVGSTFYTITGIVKDDGTLSNEFNKMEWGTWTWTQLDAYHDQPPARSSAASARVGDQLYVFFGLGADLITYDDLWFYNLLTRKWTQIEDAHWVGISAGRTQTGKIGASAVERGTMIWIFGGYYTTLAGDRTFTNEIITFDVSDDVNELEQLEIDPLLPAPEPRSHAAVIRLEEELFVWGGYDSAENEFDELWAFSPVFSRWYKLPVRSSSRPIGKAGATFFELQNGTVVLIGGSRLGYERWGMDVFRPDNDLLDTWYIKWFPMISTPPVNETLLTIQRSEAAVAGSGRNVLICGGATTDELSTYVEPATCLHWDAVTGANSILPVDVEWFTPVMNSVSIWFKNQFILLGGSVVLDGVVRDDVCSSAEQIFVFDKSSVCKPNVKDDSTCMLCSEGTYPNTTTAEGCEMTPQGTFIEAAGDAPVLCDAGEYTAEVGSVSAQACLPCPEDTYAPVAGMSECIPCPSSKFCPIRASTMYEKDANTEAAGTARGVATDKQPAALARGRTKVSVYFSFLGAVVAMVLTTVIIVVVQRFTRSLVVRRVIPAEVLSKIEATFQRLDSRGDGLDEHKLSVLLLQVFMITLDEELITQLAVEFDSTGTRHLFLDDVVDIVVKLILEHPHFPQFTESEHAKQPVGGALQFLGRFQFKKLDNFAGRTTLMKLGFPIMKTKTNSGGVMTIVFGLGAIILVVLQILSFQFENIFETRGTIPRVVSSTRIYTDMDIEFGTNGDENKDNCVLPGTTNNCTRYILNVVGIAETSRSMTCRFSGQRTCIATYSCKKCYLTENQAVIDFVMLNDDWFADQIDVTFAFESGIENEVSRASFSTYSLDNYVFKGGPATKVFAELTPTRYTAVRSVWDQSLKTQDGYHVRSLPAFSSAGNQIDNSGFPHVFSVPISLTLTELDQTLTVNRLPSITVVSLVSLVLGGVSGLMGALAFLLKVYDAVLLRWLNSRKVDVLSKRQPSQRSLDVDQQRQRLQFVERYMGPMLKNELSFSQATAIVHTARKIVQDLNDVTKRDLMFSDDIDDGLDSGEEKISDSLQKAASQGKIVRHLSAQHGPVTVDAKGKVKMAEPRVSSGKGASGGDGGAGNGTSSTEVQDFDEPKVSREKSYDQAPPFTPDVSPAVATSQSATPVAQTTPVSNPVATTLGDLGGAARGEGVASAP